MSADFDVENASEEQLANLKQSITAYIGALMQAPSGFARLFKCIKRWSGEQEGNLSTDERIIELLKCKSKELEVAWELDCIEDEDIDGHGTNLGMFTGYLLVPGGHKRYSAEGILEVPYETFDILEETVEFEEFVPDEPEPELLED